ncbi:MAG TPA: DUF488 domain-containing protein, partial [Geobacterales bacterium]|nr:DUF488 domain-containing protein [Geobacterales bacterium]
MDSKLELFTIGHSNRHIENFLDLLKKYEIEILVDIRRWPSSSKFPHFNRDNLRVSLESLGMKYMWIESLGGFRKFGRDVN